MTDASLLDPGTATSTRRTVDGVDLHVVEAGDPADPLVVLLHGFPDFWYGWRHQIAPLAEAGYRVLVPDMRGYNLSDAPSGLAAYKRSRLSADVAGLIASEGRDSAHVVGHDWGGVVAWDLALRQPEVVDRLGICNVPHPRAMFDAIRANPRQLLRSWYVLALQLPWLPEWATERNEFELFERILTDELPPGTVSDTEVGHYRAAWRAGSVRAMVDYYRAAVRRWDEPPRMDVTAPTLLLWGEDDAALVPEAAEASRRYCTDAELELYPGVSHWVQIERAAAVTDRLLWHLA